MSIVGHPKSLPGVPKCLTHRLKCLPGFPEKPTRFPEMSTRFIQCLPGFPKCLPGFPESLPVFRTRKLKSTRFPEKSNRFLVLVIFEFFNMLNCEIANSKNIGSLRICPTVYILIWSTLVFHNIGDINMRHIMDHLNNVENQSPG